MSQVAADPILRVRATPRPDPLPVRGDSPWTQHAPWFGAVVLILLAGFLPDVARLGLLASGAAIMAIFLGLARADRPLAWQALHFGCGTLALAALHGAAAAGSFALAVGVLLLCAMVARAAALDVRPALAPLAGRLPWRFAGAYRRMAFRFGLLGLLAALLLALFGVSPGMRLAGVAAIPIALRSFIGNLLAPWTTHATWAYSFGLHLALLAVLVPAFGTLGAAAALVCAETMLFVGLALTLARRTGVAAVSIHNVAVLAAGVLLFAVVAIPATPLWPFLAALACGAIAGAVLYPRSPAGPGWEAS